MKRRYVALLLVLAFTLGTMAGGLALGEDNPITVLLNGHKLYPDTPPVIINDRVMIPVSLARVIAPHNEEGNRILAKEPRITWDAGARSVNIDTTLQRPPIEGDEEFVTLINQALDLLEEKDYPHYVMICQHVNVIKRYPKAVFVESDTALAEGGLGEIRILDRLANDNKRYNTTYLAGVLVHEGIHNADELITITPSGAIIVTSEAEKEIPAYEHEAAALKIIGAPQWMIDEKERAVQRYK